MEAIGKGQALVGALAAAILLLPLLGGCAEKRQGPPPGGEAVPVVTAPVERKAVADKLSAVGTVEASATVGVKSQVGGILTEIGFSEGQMVRLGDLLFRIDPRPLEAALRQAEADLAKDAAQLEGARKDEARYAELAGKGMVAQAQYEQYRTAATVLAAAVEADKAAVENARLQLSFTSITAPIAGRAGSLAVDRGNLVKAMADTPLVVINQIDPVYVSFAVPESLLSRILSALARGPVKVAALVEGEGPREGTLTFIENQVDRATGTIRLRGTFPNHDRVLWPGRFARVELTLGVQADALVIPSVAVQMGQKGSFVFVVKDGQTVEVRPIQVGRMLDAETVVKGGLAPGENVVTDGLLRLAAGSKVTLKGASVFSPAGSGTRAPGGAPRP